MAEVTLQAEIRDIKGKKVNTLRRKGKVPGIFYLHGEKNLSIAIPEKSILKLINSTETNLINLKLDDGTEQKCILKDWQLDPVTDRPIHVDLQGIRLDEKITIEVPVILTGGIPQGVKDGGMLQHIVHKLKISCLPKYIPQHIEINTENLQINQSIHVKDLQIENYTILENENTTLVAVLPPLVEKAAAEVAPVTEEVTEPEVVSKGKKAAEGEEEEKSE